MKLSFKRSAWTVAAALSMMVVAACGEDLLAPPDGTACTAGTISPGDSVASAITGASCRVFSDYNETETTAESWTLNAKAHTAYVVRVYHLADTAAFDNWNGDVFIYGRNAGGDAVWAGGWWNKFGPTNGNSNRHQELIFTSTKDQVVSIRVEAYEVADTGHYAIQVESCAAPAIAAGDTSTAVAVEEGCLTKSMIGGDVDGRAAFWTFQGDTLNTTEVQFSLTGGNGNLRGWATGEGLDYACWSSSWCTYEMVGPSATSISATPTIYLTGDYSATAVVHADSTATVAVGIVNTPITAPRPPFTGPARAGRTR